MKITNKHVAIVAGVLGFLAWQYYAQQDQLAEQAAAQKAAEEAYAALSVEEKVAIDIRKYLTPFYLAADKPKTQGKKLAEAAMYGGEYNRCGVDCLVTAEDVKDRNIKEEGGEFAYKIPGAVWINKMLEKEYPKNGDNVGTCEDQKAAYRYIMQLGDKLDWDYNKIVMRLKGEFEQNGAEWGEKQPQITGTVKFAIYHKNVGIEAVKKDLQGKKVTEAKPNIYFVGRAKEYEGMCYEKGNVGMVQTMMLYDAFMKE